MSPKEKRDMAHSIDIYPIIISNPIFRNLHKELLYNIGRYMENLGSDRTLLVLGSSSLVSPYGNNKSWLDEALGPSGRFLVMDYNIKIIAKGLLHLQSKKFFPEYHPQVHLKSVSAKSYLLEEGGDKFLQEENADDIIFKVTSLMIDPHKLPEKSMLFTEGNLSYGLNIKSSSVDCVDSTLTLHHVAAYRQQLKYVLQEIYRVLKPGGMFHYGDIFVDMRSSERKINRILNLVTTITGEHVTLYDYRDPEWKVTTTYSPNREYEQVPRLDVVTEKPESTGLIVEVTPEAEILIPNVSDKISATLSELGYTNRTITPDYIIIPIIDPNVETQHVQDINEFQDLIIELKKGLYATTNFTEEEIDAAIVRGHKEREISLKGIVEYSSSREFLIDLLKEVGFEKIVVELPNKEAGYKSEVAALIAYKAE